MHQSASWSALCSCKVVNQALNIDNRYIIVSSLMGTRGGNRPCTAPAASGSSQRRRSLRFAISDQDPRSLGSRLDSPIVEGIVCWLVPIGSGILPRRLPAPHPYKDSTATCGMCTPVLQERLSIDCNRNILYNYSHPLCPALSFIN